MKNSVYTFLALIISLGLGAYSQSVYADSADLGALKEELRAEYKQDLANYRALEDPSADSAVNMRQKLVEMGTQAKKIRDLMNEINAKSEDTETVSDLRDQLQTYIDAFRQARGDFSNYYAEYNKPADEESIEETIEPENVEKIVISEELPERETADQGFDDTMIPDESEDIAMAGDSLSAESESEEEYDTDIE